MDSDTRKQGEIIRLSGNFGTGISKGEEIDYANGFAERSFRELMDGHPSPNAARFLDEDLPLLCNGDWDMASIFQLIPIEIVRIAAEKKVDSAVLGDLFEIFFGTVHQLAEEKRKMMTTIESLEQAIALLGEDGNGRRT